MVFLVMDSYVECIAAASAIIKTKTNKNTLHLGKTLVKTQRGHFGTSTTLRRRSGWAQRDMIENDITKQNSHAGRSPCQS